MKSTSARGRRFGIGVVLALVASTVVWVAPPVDALTVRPFAIRYQADINGAIDIFANTLMTCRTAVTNCTAAQNGTSNLNNNAFDMVAIDADTFATTTNSSRATVTYPTGAVVRFAGLYWGADSSSTTRNRISFRRPGDTAYTTITASQLDATGVTYQGFADVTASVAAAGAGEYWAGNVALTQASGEFAGWSLVVVFEHPTQPLRNLTVFDGFGQVTTNSASDRVLNIPISGFLAPPFGAVLAEVGVVAYEGDSGTTGDALWLDPTPDTDSTPDGTRLRNPNALGTLDPDNFFNSTISTGGVNDATTGSMSPSYRNTLGFDADEADASGLIANSATSVGLTLTTAGDFFYPGVVTTAIDLYAPTFPNQTKTVTNLTRGPGPALPGDLLEYTLTVSNTGLDPADNSRLTDVLPPNVTYVGGSLAVTAGANIGVKSDSAANDQAEYISASRSVVFRVGTGATGLLGGSLIPNDSTTLKFRVTVDAAAAGTTIANSYTLTYTARTIGRSFSYSSNVANTPVSPLADLVISKSASPNPVVAGATVTYLVSVTNDGPSAASDVVISDTLPGTVVLVSATPSSGSCAGTTCALGTIANAATATVSYVVTASATLATGALLGNSATVTSSTLDPNPGNESVSITTPVVESADLSIGKAVSPNPLVPGANATWTITVSNAGPSTARSVAVADTLPAEAFYVSVSPSSGSCPQTGAAIACNLGDLPPGQSRTVTIVAVISPSVAPAETVANAARATSVTTDTNMANNSATVSAPVNPRADLAIVKAVDSSPITPGAPASWTITVTNNGPSDARAVTVDDPAPAGVTMTSASSTIGACTVGAGASCTLGTLPAGASATMTVVGDVTPAAADGSSITNVATVATTTTDTNSANNSATSVTPVVASVSLEFTKTAAPNPVIAGTPLVYTLAATNVGPSNATGVLITDAAPPGVTFTGQTPSAGSCAGSNAIQVTCAIGGLPAGATAVVTITATVDPASLATEIINTASIDSAQTTAQNASFSNDVLQQADISIDKTALTSSAVAGQTATWRLTIGNAGPSVANGISVTDLLPAGMSATAFSASAGTSCSGTTTVTCNAASLAVGGTIVVDVAVSMARGMVAGPVANSASVTATTPLDPTASNNSSTGTLTVQRSADVQISKVATGSLTAGSPLSWRITATNAGPSDASDTTITDVLRAGTTFVPASSDGRCTASGQLVTCDLASLAAGASTDLVIAVATSPSLAAASSVANTAQISTTTPDPVTSNNSATATATVATSANVSVAKSAPASLAAGRPATWTVTVTNSGPSDAQQVSVADTAPAGVTFTSVTSSVAGTTCTLASSCTIATLAGGATATITYVGDVSSSAAGTITNSATATSSTPDPDSGNNVSATATPVTATADLQVAKRPNTSTIVAGTQAAWTITVTNAGPSIARTVTLSDLVDAPFALVTLTPSSGTCDAALATCALGDIPLGATVTIGVVTSTPADQAGATISNTVSASSTTADPTPGNNTAVATLPVVGSADISISKAVAGSSLIAGAPVRWVLTVINNGPSNASDVVVNDTVHSSVGALSADPTAGTCLFAGQLLGCDLGEMTPGQQIVIVVDGTLAAGTVADSSVANTATVTSPTPDPGAANNASTAVAPVITRADLSTTKTVTGPLVAGGPISWTITVANAGPSTAAAVSVADSLPAGITGTTVTPSQGSCSAFPCALGSIAAGSSATVTVAGTIGSTFAGTSITNTAVASSTTVDPSAGNNSASVTAPVTTSADLRIVKSAVPASGPVIAGQTITYTLSVVNDGPSTAQAVTVADTLPAGVTIVGSLPSGCSGSSTITCTLGALSVSATPVTRSFTVRVGADATLGSSVVNVATVSSSTTDPDSADNTSQTSTSVGTQADLVVTKVAVGAPFVPGLTAGYTITVANAGPSIARAVNVVDVLPDGFVPTSMAATPAGVCTASTGTCALGDINPGDAVVVSLAGTLTSDVTASLTNRAVAASTTVDADLASNTATVVTPVAPRSDVSIVKSVVTDPVVPGEPVRFRLEIRNVGPSDAQSVVVSDVLPTSLVAINAASTAGSCAIVAQTLTCAIGTLPPNPLPAAPVVILIDADVVPSATGTLSNTATITTTTAQSAGGQPDSSTVTAALASSADVRIAKIAPNLVVLAGEPVVYDVVVTNDGPSDAATVAVTETPPVELTALSLSASNGGSCVGLVCTWAVIPVGATRTISVSGTISSAATSVAANRVSVTSATADPDPADNDATAGIVLGTNADLSLTKTAPATADAGTDSAYTLTVANAGPSDAAAVVIDDVLPAGVVVGTLPAGCVGNVGGNAQAIRCSAALLSATAGSNSLAFVIPVNFTADLPAGPLANDASVSSATPDDTPQNNTDTAVTLISRVTDVVISKTRNSATGVAGRSIAFDITVAVPSTGPSSAEAVSVSDPLPLGTTLDSVAVIAGSGSCAATGSLLSCSLGTMFPGATTVVRVVLDVDPGFASASTADITNTAVVSTITPQSDTADDSSDDSITIAREADIGITKSVAPAGVAAGQAATWTVIVTNHGPSDALGVLPADSVPTGFLVSGVSDSLGACQRSGQSIDCVPTDLANGATWTITVVGAVDPTAPAVDIVNTASVNATTAEGSAATFPNSALATLAVSQIADLTIDKTASPDRVVAGRLLTWTITVGNAGPSVARAVTVTDTLPAGILVPAISSSQGACTALPCNLGDLAAGSSATVTIAATIASGYTGADIINSASVSSPTDSTDSSAVATSSVITQADLSIAKTASADPVRAGEAISWELAVINTGASDALNVVVTDTLPVALLTSVSAPGCTIDLGLGIVTCTVATLAAGSGVAFTISATVLPSVMAGSITNTASVVSSTPDVDTADQFASVTSGVVQRADLVVSKSGVDAVAGQLTTWTITVGNSGPSVARNVTVADQLASLVAPTVLSPLTGCAIDAALLLGCSLGDLSPGGSVDVVVRGAVDAAFGPAPMGNTATAASDTVDDGSGPNAATATIDVATVADLRISKFGPSGAATPGAAMSWTIRVVNDGPSDAQSVVIDDLLPTVLLSPVAQVTGGSATCVISSGAMRCTAPRLASGAEIVVQLFGQISSAATSATLDNVATVVSNTADPDASDNSATASSILAPVAALAVTGSSSPVGGVSAGQSATFSFNVTNTGPSVAANTVLTLPLPAGISVDGTPVLTGAPAGSTVQVVGGTMIVTLGAVPPGASINLSFAGATAPGILVSALDVTATATTTTMQNVTADDAATVELSIRNTAPLTVTKSASAASVRFGSTVTFTITVANAGPSTAHDVAIVDMLPSGLTPRSADAGAIIVGQTVQVAPPPSIQPGSSFTLTIVALATGVGSVTNTATATATGGSPAIGTATVLVERHSDLRLTKTASAGTARAATAIVWTVTLTNFGPDPAAAVVVREVMPSNARFLEAISTKGVYDSAAATWTLPDVAAGATETLVIRALGVDPGPSINRVELVASDGLVDSLEGNVASAEVMILPARLPATGSDVPALLIAALVAAAVGCALVVLSQRRRRTS
jgi:uncharacterized repeat protein (TIGR01451 family)